MHDELSAISIQRSAFGKNEKPTADRRVRGLQKVHPSATRCESGWGKDRDSDSHVIRCRASGLAHSPHPPAHRRWHPPGASLFLFSRLRPVRFVHTGASGGQVGHVQPTFYRQPGGAGGFAQGAGRTRQLWLRLFRQSQEVSPTSRPTSGVGRSGRLLRRFSRVLKGGKFDGRPGEVISTAPVWSAIPTLRGWLSPHSSVDSARWAQRAASRALGRWERLSRKHRLQS
jgi:hypothetical protein